MSGWRARCKLTGVLSFMKGPKPTVSKDLEDHQIDQSVIQWSMKKLVRKPFCFRIRPASQVYRPEKVIDGFNRPYGGPHLWMSEPLSENREAWLELRWPAALSISEIHLTFNDDVNEDLINLHHHRTPFDIIPELVRDYRLEACGERGWYTLLQEQGNRKRKRVHRFERPINTNQLRLVVEATNGGPRAEVVEVRVY